MAQPGSDLGEDTAIEHSLLSLFPFPPPFVVSPPKSNLVNFSLKIWHSVAPFWADRSWHTYAKPLVHYWPRTTYVLNCVAKLDRHKRAHTCPQLRPWGGGVKATAMHFIQQQTCTFTGQNVIVSGNGGEGSGGPLATPVGCAIIRSVAQIMNSRVYVRTSIVITTHKAHLSLLQNVRCFRRICTRLEYSQV